MNLPHPPVKRAKLNPEFLARVLLGSTALGGSVGLINSLMRQRRTILDDDAPAEDEVVIPSLQKTAYDALDVATAVPKAINWVGDLPSRAINAMMPPSAKGGPPAPQPEGVSGLDLALGGAAIPVGFLGGLHMARGAFQSWRRQDLKQRLKDEEEAYNEALRQEAQAEHSKRASSDPAPAAEPRQPLTMGQLATMGIAGLPIMSALTAGVLTHRFLSQQFPLHKKKTDRTRVRFEDDPASAEEKMATAVAPELLIHTVLEMHKLACDSGVADVIGAVAAGKLADMEDVMQKSGYEAAFQLVEGMSSHVPSDPLTKCAAVRRAVQSGMAEPLKIMAAAAFANAAPYWRHMGEQINQFGKMASAVEQFGGLAVLLHVAAAAGPEVLTKAASLASIQGDPEDALAHMFSAPYDGGMSMDATPFDDSAATDASTLQTGAANVRSSDGSSQSDVAELQSREPSDLIDSTLMGRTQPSALPDTLT